jgi:pyrophosphatase PpaX
VTETSTPNTTAALARVAKIKAVLFDLDGTLVDTIPLILDSFRYATQTVLGTPVADDVLARNIGIPLILQLREFTDDDAVADELMRVYREHNRLHHDQRARLFEGTAEALSLIAEHGVPMGVVTSKAREIALRGLDLFELRRFFAVVITMDDVDRYKPDPFPLLKAAEAMGIAASATAYVGDSPHDVDAANRAGALSIAAPWGVSSREDLLKAQPQFVLDSMTDLPELLFGDARPFAVA